MGENICRVHIQVEGLVVYLGINCEDMIVVNNFHGFIYFM